MATPECKILHSGETLWVKPILSNGVSALGWIIGVAEGLAYYTINGGSPQYLFNGLWSIGMDSVCFPIGPVRVLQFCDDSFMTWAALTGTWDEIVAFNGTGGHFNDCGVYNSQFHTSLDGTCRWTFDSLVPGRYRLSGLFWDQVGPDRTDRALYTIKDGDGTVLQSYEFDLTQTLWPTADRTKLSYDLHDIGEFTLGSGQTSATVTLSNLSTGLLVADLLVIETVFVPIVQPGDTVVATFPDGTFTVKVVDPDNLLYIFDFICNVTLTNDQQFCEPIPAPADRIIKCGVNLDSIREVHFPVMYADRGPGNDCWTGDSITLNAHYDIATNTGNSIARTMTYYPSGDGGLTQREMFIMPEGLVRVEFDVLGVTFDTTAQNNTFLASFNSGEAPMPPNPVIGAKTITNIGGNRWRLLQQVSRPLWEPIATRTQPFSPNWDQGLKFVANVPGLVINNWKWYDPSVPIGEPGVAHPDEKTRLGSAGLAQRYMNALSTNASKTKNIGDFMSVDDQMIPTASGAPTPFGHPEYVIWRGNIISARPADLDPDTDSDDVYKHYPVSGYDCFFVCTFDSPVSDFPDGNDFVLRSTTPTTAISTTIDGYIVSLAYMWGAFQIPGKPNELVVSSGIQNPFYPTPAGERATIDNTYTLDAATGSVFKNSLIPYERILQYSADTNGEPWINVPHLASDELIAWMADEAYARTPTDRPIHVEYSNETWNPNWLQSHYISFAWQHANYLHTLDPDANPFTYPSIYHWLAHQFGHVFKIFRDRCAFADPPRDPNTVIRHLAGLRENYGITESYMQQCAIEGKSYIDFDYLSIDCYQDKDPPGFTLNSNNITASSARLSPDGKLDIMTVVTFSHGIRHIWAHDHLQRVHAVPGYEDKLLSGYEGGWSYLANYTSEAKMKYETYEMMASPRMFFLTASKQAYFQRIGFRVHCKYTLAFYATPGDAAAWSDLYCNCARLGTGSLLENKNPYLWPNSYTQTLGGRVAFANGHNFSSVPPPGSGQLRLVMPSGQLRLAIG